MAVEFELRVAEFDFEDGRVEVPVWSEWVSCDVAIPEVLIDNPHYYRRKETQEALT